MPPNRQVFALRSTAVSSRPDVLPPPEVSARSVGASLAACIGYLVGPTAIIGPPLGLFMMPVCDHFQISRSTFSLILSAGALIVALTSPLAGHAIDRYGVRRVVLPAVMLFGVAEIGMGLTYRSILLYVAAYGLVAVLAGIQNPIAYTKVISLWFNRHRGTVLAIVGAIGGGGGGIVVPQLADWLIRRGGWQLGYVGLGVFIIVLGMPMLFLFLREPRGARDKQVPAMSDEATDASSLTRSQAIRTRMFWMILVAVALVSGSVAAVSVHFPVILQARGVASHLPALFLSFFAFGSVVGQLTTGPFLDRIDSPKIGAPFFIISFIGILTLWRLSSLGGALPLAGGFMTGTGYGAELGLACYYISRFFGLHAYGEIYGAIFGALVAASALGPFLMGLSFDRLGSYDLALGLACASMLVSILLILLLPPYTFNQQQSRKAIPAMS